MGRWLGWAAGAVGLVAIGVLVGLRERDEGLAYATGAAIGALTLALAVAFVVRFLYARGAGDVRVLSPWLLLIACVVALFTLPFRRQHERRELKDEVDRARTATERCRQSAGKPFRPLPAGLRYRTLRPSERRDFTSVMPGELSKLFDVRMVTGGGGDLAIVLSAATGGNQDDAQRGFEDEARRNGARLRSIRIGERTATYGRVQGMIMAGAAGECDWMVVGGPDLETVRAIGGHVFVDD